MFFSFRLLGREIPLYGLCIVIGGAIASLIAARIFQKQGWPVDDLILSETLGIAGAFLGAKLLFLAVSWKQIDWSYIRDLETFNNFMSTGFVFYGGLIGAAAGLFFTWKVWKIPVIRYLDKIAFCIPLGHGFGRIGCFCGGCCYGIPWTGPLHIIFPESNPYTLSGVPLFPVQLLEAAVLFLISFTLYLAYRQNRKHLFADYILLYAPSRFLIEFLRYDDAERGFWGILSTSQWVSILLFAAALLYLTIIYKEGDHYGSSIRRT